MQEVQARQATLGRLEAEFGLITNPNSQFFPEWISDEICLTSTEIQALSRIKSNFAHLQKASSMSEEAVKLVVLSPLLDLAGFYQPPFRIKPIVVTIDVTDIEAEDVIRGEIDVLSISEKLCVLAFKSKQSTIALNVALPQALSYMLTSSTQPRYGLIMSGSDFIFVKLNWEETPQYATSRVFSLFAPGNELVEILKILKRIVCLTVNQMVE